MAIVGCPQCGARVVKPETGKPICPKCGFGTRAPGAGPSRLRSVYGDPRQGGKMDLPITPTGKVTSPVGGPRDPLQVLLLMAATLGIYWFVWVAMAFFELSRLHGRKHPWARFVIGFLLWPIMLLYFFMEVAQLEIYRLQRGLPRASPVGRFVGFFLLGAFLVFLPSMFFVLWLAGSTLGYVLMGIGIAAGVGLMAWMIYEAQDSMNGIWRSAGITG